jgi:hypothetical protein
MDVDDDVVAVVPKKAVEPILYEEEDGKPMLE